MPAKIGEVTALSCTSAGMERGSEAVTRRWTEKVKSEATDGTAPISARSWSSTARHSTRAIETGGVMNASAANAGAPAGSVARTASDSLTNLKNPLVNRRSPAANSPAVSLVLCAFYVRAVLRHDDDPCPNCNMWRYAGANAVGEHGGLVGGGGGLALGHRLGLDDFKGHALRQLQRDHIRVVERELHGHVLLQVGGGIADDVLGDR